MKTLLAPFAALCLFALGGCAQEVAKLQANATGINTSIAVTTGVAAVASPTAAKALTKVNTTIANASQKVNTYLPVVSAVVNADCVVASLSSAGAKACAVAKTFIAAYQSGAAPTDLVSLAQTAENVIVQLSQSGMI